MGKKVKKKARSGHKDKRVSSASPKTVSQDSNTNTETPKEGVVVEKDKRLCPHLDKGVDLEKVLAKLKSSEPLKCEDCRDGVVDRRASKGKGKHGKKKGGAEVKSESKAIWVCLECGHFSCGGIGFPTTPQSHAVRHARQHRHPLAVQFENPQLRWCFPCNTIIPVEKSEDNGEQKDVLDDIMKAIKGRSTGVAATDVEDIWFGSGSVTSGIKSESLQSIASGVNSSYIVRGLMNLGNTCFFNSIMQNLLAMDKLRDYFLKLDGSLGPLTASLKKLYIETNPEAGLRGVINPRSFFGCVCAKAPQFRGYQQHDSHELLRCLLDALSTEEASARKQMKYPQEGGSFPQTDSPFVDDIFGGQLSSTVSCLECGHSSTVYEPFLDLSLPVPTKKPPSRKAQPISRAKKQKQPPKRSGKNLSKVKRDATTQSAHYAADQTTGGESSLQVQSGQTVVDQSNKLSADSLSVDDSRATASTSEIDFVSQNLFAAEKVGSKQGTEDVCGNLVVADDSTWLDYLNPGVASEDYDIDPQIGNVSLGLGSGTENAVLSDSLLPNAVEPSLDTTPCSDDMTWLDFCGRGNLSNHNGMASQINAELTPQDTRTKDAAGVADDSTWLDYVEPGVASEEYDMDSQTGNVSVDQGSGIENAVLSDSLLPNTLEPSADTTSACMDAAPHSGDMTWLDFCGPGNLSDHDGMTSRINAELESQDTRSKGTVQSDVNLEHSSDSCNPVSLNDSNVGVDSSGKSWEDEIPMQVHDSPIILLPYKEDASVSEIFRVEDEASSSAVECDPSSLEFDGFADLFNEPEAVAGPSMESLTVAKSSEANAATHAGFLVGNSSESDPDEVDNSDAPVSVDSCLSYFVKPELLSKDEHAWQCENCSKVLLEKKERLKKKLLKPRLDIAMDGIEDKKPSAFFSSGESRHNSIRLKNLCNGTIDKVVLDTNHDCQHPHTGEMNDKNGVLEMSGRAELEPLASQIEDEKPVKEDAPRSSNPDKSCCEGSYCNEINEPDIAEGNKDTFKQEGSELLAVDCQSEESEHEEMDSDNVKVRRDATKRILVSRAPPILTIHLKRFSQDARGRLSKLNGHVDFRDTIELKPFTDPRCTETDRYKYRLLGVVEHLGTMRGGHYVAYVRGGTKGTRSPENGNEDFIWYHASDAYVREATLEEVLRCEAYILFYEQI